MKKPQDLKIKYKLIAIILSITLITLTIAFTGVSIYYGITLRKSIEDKTEIISRVIGNGMVSILSFGNKKESQNQMAGFLKDAPSVKNAFVYNENDVLFGEYNRTESDKMAPPPAPQKNFMIFKNPYIETASKIIYKGIKIGTLYMRVSAEELEVGIKNLILAMCLIILLLIPISLILATKFQAIISKPILNLANVTKKVSSNGNYSIRVNKTHNDEVGILYDSFNDMMEQIHNRDIQRDRVENELKNAEFFLSSVLESMPLSLITIDPQGIVSLWNQAVVQLTGISLEEAVGKVLWELIPGFQKYKSTINDVTYNNKKTVQFNKELIKLRETTFYLNVTIFPLINNLTPKFVIIVNNVTDTELKEQQLRQSQKMETVGTLAGGLAHDFNNVLGGIIGTISLYKYKVSQKKEVTKSDIEKYFTTIEDSANRASDMVQHLLSLTRKQELNFTPTDLNDIVKSTIKICKNTFDKSIDIHVTYADEDAVTYADSTQIEQSLLNLCINAAHAMTIMRKDGDKYGGTLNVSLEKVQADKYFFKMHPDITEDQYYWRISIQDTGVGINPQILSKIFDPFFTTKGEGLGTGLGLAMVYNIVKQHKGFIDVYSQEDIGTTFHIYLPYFESSSIRRSNKSTDVVHHGEGLILVIDDEEVMRQTAKSILEECGYEVILAGDGEEGVEIYKKHMDRVKAVVLDMVMPKMSGKQAFIELQKLNKDIKVLLASGFKQDSRVETILKLGVKGFIQKPFGLIKLANSIYDIINE